jgi:hypothetical protein
VLGAVPVEAPLVTLAAAVADAGAEVPLVLLVLLVAAEAGAAVPAVAAGVVEPAVVPAL